MNNNNSRTRDGFKCGASIDSGPNKYYFYATTPAFFGCCKLNYNITLLFVCNNNIIIVVITTVFV